MRPTTREIIDGISWVLDNRVSQVITDKWASSYLRSIKGLLAHLSIRAEEEGEILWQDIADQRHLLNEIRATLSRLDRWPEILGTIDSSLAHQWREPAAYPAIKSLEAENLAYRQSIETCVTAVHERTADWPDEEKDEMHSKLVAYLRRQMKREEVLYRGPFSGLPF
ncbi:MAG: hypothetical protein CMQ20_08295 [Gammaproteobacteria bacterium]|jgi:hypothetical protein|nr:hypothetical protein [Gammaproteobacteria bacterium]|tara:strand:+ start:2216 stop:2716 length:501 start_codon:yes stop_codon:yes gene_type:complete